jgi:hypothetical protein
MAAPKVWDAIEAMVVEPSGPKQGGVMAKRHYRPSAQYRYEHYDPFKGFGR